jgi:hypothetical protein
MSSSRYERFRDYLTPFLGRADADMHAKALMDLLETPGGRGDDPLGLVAMGIELLPMAEIAQRLNVTTSALRFLMRPPGPMRRKVRFARVNGQVRYSLTDAQTAIEEHRPILETLEGRK